MQAARELVVFVGKFTTGMQPAQDQFDAADAFFRVNIDWHTTAIINDFNRLIRMQNNLHCVGMPG